MCDRMAHIKEWLLSFRVGSHKDAVQGCVGRHEELMPGPHSRQSLLHVTKPHTKKDVYQPLKQVHR